MHWDLQEKNTSARHVDSPSVQDNFDLITSYMQRQNMNISLLKRKIRRKIRIQVNAEKKKTSWIKLRNKFRVLDMREQHDLYINNLMYDISSNPRYMFGKKKKGGYSLYSATEEKKWYY